MSEVKSMNEHDNPEIESEPETKVVDVPTVQGSERLTFETVYHEKRHSQALNDEPITALEKVDKFSIFTRTQESTQTKITDYFK